MKMCPCLSWVPRRYVICILCFFGMMMTYIMRFCLSIAITEMVHPHPRNTSSGAQECPYDDDGSKNTTVVNKGEFAWSEHTQGMVLSSFFWGYVLTQLPGGMVAERIGGKYTLALAIFVSALGTLATPVTARWGGAAALMVLRILMGLAQGLVYPSLNALLSKWVAIEERGRLGALVFVGANFGNVVSMSVSGLLLSWKDWAVLFYIYGVAALLWLGLWMCFGYSRPEDHPGLSEAEKQYLEEYFIKVHMQKKLPPTPWRHILRSVPLWGLVIAQIGHDWGLFTIVTDLPKYMKTVIHFSIAKTGLTSALPYVAMVVVALLSGTLVDFLLLKGVTSITTSRKIFTSIASVGPAAGIVGASFAECDRVLVTIYLILGMGLMGFFYPSLKVNCLDLSPNYAGTVMGMVNGIGAVSGIITPYLIGVLIPENTMRQWRNVFLIAAVVLVVTNLVYILTASGEVQPWNDLRSAPGSERTSEEQDDKAEAGRRFQSEKRVAVLVDDLSCPTDRGFRKTVREVVIPRCDMDPDFRIRHITANRFSSWLGLDEYEYMRIPEMGGIRTQQRDEERE